MQILTFKRLNKHILWFPQCQLSKRINHMVQFTTDMALSSMLMVSKIKIQG